MSTEELETLERIVGLVLENNEDIENVAKRWDLSPHGISYDVVDAFFCDDGKGIRVAMAPALHKEIYRFTRGVTRV